MIKLASTHADEEESNILEKITGLHVFSLPNQNLASAGDVLALKQSILGNNYEPLIQIRDEGEFIDIYLRETDEVITHLFIMIEGESLTFINLSGHLQYEDLKDIDLDIEGLDSLENIPTKRGERP